MLPPQVVQTEELQPKWDTTPEQYAEWVFGMMETFPAAPMSQQVPRSRAANLGGATKRASALACSRAAQHHPNAGTALSRI